jgi:RNA polymerase sigma factor (sigma-70 family)
MSKGQLGSLLVHIRRILAGHPVGGLTDRQLLKRFAVQQEEAAFAALMQRHGPLVWGVCWRTLQHTQDAEDVFQATFLVLARKAGSMRWQRSVGNWLYEVAHRLATEAKSKAARRRVREQRVVDMPKAEPVSESAWRELCSVLDEELQGLSGRFRTPLLLCYLQGRTRDQAAQELGCSLRTLDRRLERGRELLRVRLTRRGVTMSAALLATGLSQSTATAIVPATLIASVVKVAATFAASSTAAPGLISAGVTALAEGGLQAMFMTKLKIGLALMLAASLLATGAGIISYQAFAARQSDGRQGNAPKQDVQRAAQAKPDRQKQARVDQYGDPLPALAIARIGTARLYHNVQAGGLLYTPDGKTLITSSSMDGIRLWETATGKELHHLQPPQREASLLALSPDGKTLASAVWGQRTLELWDVATGTQLRQIILPERMVGAISFSREGKMFATATVDKIIRLWDAATWRETRQLAGHQARIIFVGFLPDGHTLVSASNANTIRWWDTERGRQIRIRDGLEDLSTVVLSPNGKILASARDRRMLQFWNTATGEAIGPWLAWEYSLSFAFSPDSQVLAYGEPGGTIRFLSVPSGLELRSWERQDHVPALAFSPDGKVLAQAEMGVIRLRDAVTGQPALHVPRLPGQVMSLAFAPNSKTLITSCWGGAIGFWDPLTGKERAPMKPPPEGLAGPVRALEPTDLAPDGKMAAMVDAKEVLHLWDTATGKGLLRINDPPVGHHVQAFSPDGKVLAVVHKDRVVRLWDTATGKQLGALPLLPQILYPRAFSPDGRVLATSSPDSTIRLWETATGKELGQLSWQDRTVARWLAFTPDGRALVSSHFVPKPLPGSKPGGSLRLWDVNTARLSRQFDGPMSEASLAISPDGKTLAAGDASGTIHLWELSSRKERGRFSGHRHFIWSLAFSPDGRLLASGSSDHTALVWDVTGL